MLLVIMAIFTPIQGILTALSVRTVFNKNLTKLHFFQKLIPKTLF
jgi:hypothetical protein